MDIKFYSLQEVADIFGVEYQLIYKLVKAGTIPSMRVGKVFRISSAQMQEYMDRMSNGGSPASGAPQKVCSRCGRNYYSALSISKKCAKCGAPICKACVENDHATLCEIHQIKEDAEKVSSDETNPDENQN